MPDTPLTAGTGLHTEGRLAVGSPTSGVAWPAIIAGAFAAAAVSLILVALGAGLGLAAISPWTDIGASAATFTVTTVVWMIVTQWLSSGLGGYLTGRLRSKWVGADAHDVLFRDTANGFLTWAVAAVIGAAVVAFAASSVVIGVSGIASDASRAAMQSSRALPDPTAYFVDSLYRTDRPNMTAADADTRSESMHILLNGGVSAPDRAWLAQLVSNRTGLSKPDAEKRVDAVMAQMQAAETRMREIAGNARKAGSYLSIFTALAMVIGAFIACVTAAMGGMQRDKD